MTKSEALSWFRIYEMFRFESFHMYGIIGTAVGLGIISVQLIKRFKWKTIDGGNVLFSPKAKTYPRYIIGGIVFGMGWALVGACPGPMFVLLGQGVFPILIVLFGSLLGTFLYGVFRDKLPH